MAFNENSRVKIPAILTLTRLGYEYLSLKHATWDKETNIFSDIFMKVLKTLIKMLIFKMKRLKNFKQIFLYYWIMRI